MQDILNQALAYHQSGQWDLAEASYKQLIRDYPQNGDAWHLYGLLYLQRQKPDQAEYYVQEAVKRQANPLFLDSLGKILMELGRWSDAAIQYQTLTALNPHQANAYYWLGCCFQALDETEPAITALSEALRLDAAFTEAYEALAQILSRSGRFVQARDCLTKALKLNPENPRNWLLFGDVLTDLHCWPEAESAYRQSLSIQPECVEALNNLGLLFALINRKPEAIDAYQQAILLQPDYPDPYINLAGLFQRQGDYTQAIRLSRQALQLNPDAVEALVNLGISYYQMGQTDSALSHFDTALAKNPDHVDVHLSRAHALLQSEDFTQGWREYEWRWKLKGVQPFHSDRPVWDGTPSPEATILVYSEGGFGDAFQFYRYIQKLRASCKHVIWLCPASTVSLFQRCGPMDTVLPLTEPTLPPYDFQISLMTLAGLFARELAALQVSEPYLFPPPDKASAWRDYYHPRPGLKVGLVWSGAATIFGESYRACPLPALAALGKVSGVQFYSLQKGPAALADAATVQSMLPGLVDLADAITDFDDTAAIISNLDLVITVDTGVVHLASGLGCPTWVILPYASEWRWFKNRTDTPWYPETRLFRQAAYADWQTSLTDVAEALQTLVNTTPKR